MKTIPIRVPTSPWAIRPESAEEIVGMLGQVDWAAHDAELEARASARDAESRPYEMLGDVAVIPIGGPMTKADSSLARVFGSTSTLRVRAMLGQAMRDEGVRSILLHVDSPGGEVDGVADLADAVAACSKPVTAYIEDCGCSAAYWVASQADEVVCNRMAKVGSIGVYTVVQDLSQKAAMQGVKTFVIGSGGVKGMGVPGTEVTAEQREALQSVVDAYTGDFVMAVARGRGMTIEAASALATGHVWIGQKAVDAGLVDRIGSLEAVIAGMRSARGVQGANGGARPMSLMAKLAAFFVANGIDVEASGSGASPVPVAVLDPRVSALERERDELIAKASAEKEQAQAGLVSAAAKGFVATFGDKIAPAIAGHVATVFAVGATVGEKGDVVEGPGALALREILGAIPDPKVSAEVVQVVPSSTVGTGDRSGYGKATDTGRAALATIKEDE